MREVFARVRPTRCCTWRRNRTWIARSTDLTHSCGRTSSGTFTLLQAALEYWRTLDAERGRFRFIHVSTDEVYGSLGPRRSPFTEDTRYDPHSPYAASKAASDHLARAWHDTYGLPVIVTNCSNNYGPYQFPEKLIPVIILKALAGEPIPVYGAGDNVRDWLYVEDHAVRSAARARGGAPGRTYNIGGTTRCATSTSCVACASSWTRWRLAEDGGLTRSSSPS